MAPLEIIARPNCLERDRNDGKSVGQAKGIALPGPSAKGILKTAIAGRVPEEFDDIYRPKLAITADTKVATAGSCFAQHIARHLKSRGVPVMDLEPAPPGLKGEAARSHGFGLYSARFGNIHHVRQLLQLVWESRGQFWSGLTLA